MSEINILESAIFNRIAAGEVVESPRSVVKELVENSIDAGATVVTIEIRGGGIDYIAVMDNGKGIGQEDMPLAFLPHATSKIQSLEDLNSIATLGFRGEALPSIASVAEVTMISRRACDAVGYTVTYQNGKMSDKGELGATLGTTVRVQNLFLNIPARRKFLKKPASEASRITELVEKLILANPSISFIYTIDDVVIYRSDGGGQESALYAIYGQESEHFLSISDTLSHIRITGYVSEPLHSKHNRKEQTLIVNNRVVGNEEIEYSVYLAYKDFLMTRRYPAFVIYIEIPYDLIDVNVHPNKMCVKFVDVTSVKKMVYHAIRRVISVPVEFPMLTQQQYAAIDETVFTATTMKNAQAAQDEQKTCASGCELPKQYPDVFPSFFHIANATDVLREEHHNLTNNVLSRKDIIAQIEQCETQKKPHPVLHQAVEHFNMVQIAGKLFQTYLIIQLGDTVLLIDQHAAHERILYDKFLAEIENGRPMVQELLIPYTFTVSHEEAQLLEDACADLRMIGFEMQLTHTSTFSLSAVPVVCAGLDLSEFVQELLSNPHQVFKKTDFIKEAVAQSACKAAMKGKDDLKESEIMALINQMQTNGTVPLCPHGRPTFIKLSKLEIDKMFKRVVS